MTVIATDVTDSEDRLAARLTEAKKSPDRGIDNYFYRSHLVYQRELNQLVFRSWVYAAHISEIPNPGDYQLISIGEDSIIISRDAQGDIHAMHNICRHRGSRVCEEQAGNRKTFVCPYHGWVYNIDGGLKSARESHVMNDFNAQEHGLKKVRLAVFMGLIFINCDPDAAEFLGPLENIRQPLGAYQLENAKVAHKQTYRISANWKLVLENYLECYHCATSHRAYARAHTLRDLDQKVAHVVSAMLERTEEVTGIEGMGTAYEKVYLDAEGFGTCVYTSRYGLFDGYWTGSKDGKPLAPLMGDIKGYDGGVGDFQMGPLSFMLNYPDHCIMYRFLPETLTSTNMELTWYVNGDAIEGQDYDKDELIWLWHQTSLEDEYIITRNSEGVNSRFFEPGPFHPEFEASISQFNRWYLDTLQNSIPSQE
ncbi:MAG: aromatic ring-hydroxylating dioxygenase subunit alpha [Gammaproteobacteria bacterium]|jgi:phenylpropionate dioxygenase-like ring-hydroxylating dioxygenase large terminal subunit|nr:aromatic ring-hydroxylating dioxygenase subunit alpha [Gammaproteobacteria bacterium]MBT5202723.1 aromatic ring-hydroxylating dioxygenase subunit alpha [Gammaproteobacteria bacterium]MBT6244007.1 aromatic ring-hydroxylating dioxygenase subunit alpha [Gammaproteobacteria bacterium]